MRDFRAPPSATVKFKMAANKRKQDEKHLKILREMVALPHNKQCFDCHQRGPTYVNMTNGAFICTSCSGMLRGLNPPHRVKSISMTSFTPDEMEFLKARGNEFCRKVWLGLYDSRSHMEPDSKDETKVRDFMCQKYEKKRWYVAPTDAMYEEARKLNTPEKKEPATKPLRALGGDSVPGLRLNNQGSSRPVVPLHTTESHPGIGKPLGTIQKPVSKADTTGAPLAPPSSRSGVPDLLGELGNDPFANPSPAGQTTTPGGGFADFSSFNTQPGSSSGFPGPPPTSNNVGMLQPLGTAAPAPNTNTFPAFTSAGAETTTTSSVPAGAGDRYAALADLDSVFGGGGSTPANPNGSGGLSNNGTLSNSGTGFSSTGGLSNAGIPNSSSVPAPSAAVNWMGQCAPGGAGGSVFGAAGSPAGAAVTGGFGPQDNVWGPVPPVEQTSATPANNNPFIVSNPFGGGPQPSVSISNPFMASQQAAQPGFAQFGQAATAGGGFAQFGQTPTSTPSATQTFGGFVQTQTCTTAAPAQFGMPNGGFGGQAPWGMPAQGQVGGFGAGPGTQQAFSAGMPAAQFAQKSAQQAFGMPQSATSFGNWGPQQPAGNPFMSVGQQAIPPRSNSTNPFL